MRLAAVVLSLGWPFGLTGCGGSGNVAAIRDVSPGNVEPAPPIGEVTETHFRGSALRYQYRIPALLVTRQGTVICFAEGRRPGPGGFGAIDLVTWRSTDHGDTWGPVQVVASDGANCFQNPVPLLDRRTGRVWLALCRSEANPRRPITWAKRRVLITYSDDDGQSWAEPRDITEAVKPPDWGWIATGPGAGIQIERGPHAGRLVVPINSQPANAPDSYYLGSDHVMVSDDHGTTWRLAGTAPNRNVNECRVVELSDGRLMLNSRNDRGPGIYARQVCYSDDGGESWYGARIDASLPEPNCQAALVRCSWEPNLLLFSNPASATNARVNLTVRVSGDDGATWSVGRLLYAGPSSYSDLAVLADGRIACLYESGETGNYQRLTLARFSLDQLLEGTAVPGGLTARTAAPPRGSAPRWLW